MQYENKNMLFGSHRLFSLSFSVHVCVCMQEKRFVSERRNMNSKQAVHWLKNDAKHKKICKEFTGSISK